MWSAGNKPPPCSPPRCKARRQRGFTLVELLLVLVLAGVVMGMATVSISRYAQKSAQYRVQSRVDALVRLAPQLALQTGCWVRFQVVPGGQGVELSACGRPRQHLDLPPEYRLALWSESWADAPRTPQPEAFRPSATEVQTLWLAPAQQGNTAARIELWLGAQRLLERSLGLGDGLGPGS